jgi:two-component system, cell cycle sensor histidine kinase and response regulator CckA
VRGIVENHKGFISLKTQAGRGTIFRVYLPAPRSRKRKRATERRAGPAGPAGQGRAHLVVDDEPQIRDITAAILSRHGYRVLTAGDGAEAVAIFAAAQQRDQRVVTDLRMPNLDGAALANVVRT